jgi:hypothetical protein
MPQAHASLRLCPDTRLRTRIARSPFEGFVAWRDANREHMESFEFFAGGGGGFGTFYGPDEATLNRIMVQNPFFAYSEITVRPILDGDTALGQWREIMSEVMGAGPAV